MTRTFGAAVLVLLVPLLAVIGILAGATWKARNWDGALFGPDDKPRP
ncbi:MAG: hypothetical protein ACE5IK_04985 [Acidobacteriota bacterium]